MERGGVGSSFENGGLEHCVGGRKGGERWGLRFEGGFSDLVESNCFGKHGSKRVNG